MNRRLAFIFLQLFAFSIAALNSQIQSSTPPVRILKQINRQNEDGSYSYGYENEDGSYKIETKSANGEVSGKYGYVNAAGKLIEIEYGASNRGFEPVGPGITVPPPTLHVQSNNIESDYDDGQYREDPSIYDRTETAPIAPKLPLRKTVPVNAPNYRFQSVYPAQPQHQQQPFANNYRWFSGDNVISPNIGSVQYEQPQSHHPHPVNYNPYATSSYTVDFQG